MPHLRITCFQSFQATLAGQPITDFRSAKGRALLLYLAVETGFPGAHPQQRQRLAGLLWPDEAEDRARRNLSQTLLEVRRTLGDSGEQAPGFLTITPQTLAFNPASDSWLDVTVFKKQLGDVQKHSHAQLATCLSCMAQLAQAVTLYTGPFLADFSVPDSDLFENWLLTEREQLHQQAADAFSTLSHCYQAQGDLASAQQSVRRLLELAPWQEEAHRQLMLLLARSGQRTQALAQYDRCTQLLMDELGVSPSKATDALYDQILAGEISPSESEPTTGSTPAGVAPLIPPNLPTNLPAPFQVLTPPPHFVGRSDELAQLAAGLTQPGAPIYALVAMGGAGKTTLAAQLAHRVKDHFADGVLWANAATSEPLDILASWARAYGYDFSGLADVASRAAALRGVLAEKAVLIVLDNVLEVSKVQPLLPSGDCNPVLLTTRDLDVASALNAQPLLLGELSAENSRQLLATILGEARVNAEEAAAAQIGAQLHNLPLAVEIVAQRLKSRPRQPLAQMAERLGHEDHRLGLEISDRAVRASFAVSWDALDAELQRTFALLAVFAGRPFCAAAIARIDEADLYTTEDHLFSLEALSLLKAEGASYYRQHPLLADFAREKLVDADAVFGRMAAYYCDFAQENKQNYAALEPEWGNIMAAMETMQRLEHWKPLINYAKTLDAPWFTLAQYGRARQGFRLAVQAADISKDEEARLLFLTRWGYACCEQSDFAEAELHLKEAEMDAKQLKNQPLLADAQYHLARIALERGEYEDAEQRLTDCQVIRIEINDKSGAARAIHLRGLLFLRQGESTQAEMLGQEALALQEALYDISGILGTLRLLADCAFSVGNHPLGEQYARQSLDLLQDQDHKAELAEAYFTLAMACRYGQRLDEAWSYAKQSQELFEHIGNRAFLSYVFYEQSFIKSLTGDANNALQIGLKSLKLMTTLNDDYNRVFCLRHLGDMKKKMGHVTEARQFWSEGVELAIRLHHPQTPLLQERLLPNP